MRRVIALAIAALLSLTVLSACKNGPHTTVIRGTVWCPRDTAVTNVYIDPSDTSEAGSPGITGLASQPQAKGFVYTLQDSTKYRVVVTCQPGDGRTGYESSSNLLPIGLTIVNLKCDTTRCHHT